MTLRQLSPLATDLSPSTLLFFLTENHVSQCPDFGYYQGQRTPSCNWSTLQVGPRRWDFDVNQGVTYIWSFCQGGGNANWNTQITGFRENDGGNGVNTYAFDDDDVCGTASEVVWTSDYTGQIDLLITKYNCQGYGNQGSATLAYRKATPNLSIDQGSEVNTCNGLAFLSATQGL